MARSRAAAEGAGPAASRQGAREGGSRAKGPSKTGENAAAFARRQTPHPKLLGPQGPGAPTPPPPPPRAHQNTAQEQELVWVFSFWVLQKRPEEGLKIFTVGPEEDGDEVFASGGGAKAGKAGARRRIGSAGQLGGLGGRGSSPSPLPPSRVLQHLESFPHAKQLVVSYLEDLIYEQRTRFGRKEGGEESYHTRLANEYIDKALMLIEAGVEVDAMMSADLGDFDPDRDHERERARASRAAAAAAGSAGSEEGGAAELRAVRRKLVAFLRHSDEYDASKLLSRIRHPDVRLRHECVLLYAKVQQHREALRVLVHELDDHSAAERYCLANSVNSSARGGGSRAGSGGGGTGSGSGTGMEDRSNDNELLLLLLRTYLFPESDAGSTDPAEAEEEGWHYGCSSGTPRGWTL
eukprot:g668.t1